MFVVPAYLSVCVWIKEYSVFPYCRLPLLLLLWPSIVSCLVTARKEVLSTSLYTALSPLPPCILPSLIHPPVYLHLSNPVPPHVCLCFFSFIDIKHALTVFQYSQHWVILPYNVGGFWVIGCARQAHTLPLFAAFHCPVSFIHRVRDIGLEIDDVRPSLPR